jgi:peptidoglycan/LPS O-acetylase OafA/YrhL
VKKEYQELLLALGIVLATPFIAPLMLTIVTQPFKPADWFLFSLMYLFVIASATRTKLLGITVLLIAFFGSTIYSFKMSAVAAAKSNSSSFEFDLTCYFFVGAVIVMTIVHMIERYKIHVVSKEEFW